jgi:hypothetical protein
MKAYWGSGSIAPRVDLSTRCRWVASFKPRPLTPRETAPGTHQIGGWVDPRAGLDAVLKRKIRSSCRGTNPRSSSPYPRGIPLRYPFSNIIIYIKQKPNIKKVTVKTTSLFYYCNFTKFKPLWSTNEQYIRKKVRVSDMMATGRQDDRTWLLK